MTNLGHSSQAGQPRQWCILAGGYGGVIFSRDNPCARGWAGVFVPIQWFYKYRVLRWAKRQNHKIAMILLFADPTLNLGDAPAWYNVCMNQNLAICQRSLFQSYVVSIVWKLDLKLLHRLPFLPLSLVASHLFSSFFPPIILLLSFNEIYAFFCCCCYDTKFLSRSFEPEKTVTTSSNDANAIIL